jgi:hypothetical protein
MIEKEIVEKDLDKYASLESLALSEGGKILMDSLKNDIGTITDSILSRYKELPHIELIAHLANLKAKFDLYRAINRSSENKKLAKEELSRILAQEELN